MRPASWRRGAKLRVEELGFIVPIDRDNGRYRCKKNSIQGFISSAYGVHGLASQKINTTNAEAQTPLKIHCSVKNSFHCKQGIIRKQGLVCITCLNTRQFEAQA